MRGRRAGAETDKALTIVRVRVPGPPPPHPSPRPLLLGRPEGLPGSAEATRSNGKAFRVGLVKRPGPRDEVGRASLLYTV